MRVREAHIPHELPVIRALFLEYATELGGHLCFQAFEEELASLPGRYARPAGGLWIAFDQEEPVGCVALRPRTEELCELKRLYVRPKHRGTGLGRDLAESVLKAAAEFRYPEICLDTLPSWRAAVGLYRSLGFCEPQERPGNLSPDILFLKRSLP